MSFSTQCLPEAAASQWPAALPSKGHSVSWLRRYHEKSGSLYQRIVTAIEDAIAAGELQPGDQLPPQRAVADMLGVDFTTVTRAYTTARVKGLTNGTVGRGTFVRAEPATGDAGITLLYPNVPPPPPGISFAKLMREATENILENTDMSSLMTRHGVAGPLGQRVAAAMWLRPTMGAVDPERVLLCGGVQPGLSAVLTAMLEPGDAIMVEPLTYPGLMRIAEQLRLRLVVCPADEEGFVPEAVEEICRREPVRALFCVPTLHPATTVTMSVARRQALAEACRRADILIIEDDAFGRLPEEPTPAISTFAPERSFYVTSVTKSLSAGLRHGFVVAPSAHSAAQLSPTFAILGMFPSPLTSAIVTGWIRDGSVDTLVQAVRKEARERRALAARLLPQAVGPALSYHLWAPLPANYNNAALEAAALRQGVKIGTADHFAAAPDRPNGLRISLGPAADRRALGSALQTVGSLLSLIQS